MRTLKKVVRVIGFMLAVIILFILIYSIINQNFFKTVVQGSIVKYGLVAIFVSGFLLDLVPQNFSAHISILIGALIGMNMFWVTLVIVLGAGIASIFGFWLGIFFEEEFFGDIFGKNMYKRIEKWMDDYGKWYVAVSAVSPLPYIPIIFGGLRMKWKDFLIYGLVPRLLGFIITGIFANYIISLINFVI